MIIFEKTNLMSVAEKNKFPKIPLILAFLAMIMNAPYVLYNHSMSYGSAEYALTYSLYGISVCFSLICVVLNFVWMIVHLKRRNYYGALSLFLSVMFILMAFAISDLLFITPGM